MTFFAVAVPTTALLVLLVGMAALAVVDLIRQEVDDWATGVLAIGTVVALFHDSISGAQWAQGLICAALVFALYLELGTRGAMGGGDVKLSPIPALVLAVIHPLLALWSVALAFSIQSGFQLAVRPAFVGSPVALPHVPAMFLAAGVSAVVARAVFGI